MGWLYASKLYIGSLKGVMLSAQSSHYSGLDIQILEGLEAVRKRPGMYIGSTGPRGLHHLVFEVVDNAVDEALAGYCNTINVTIHSDNSITVIDNGRGIPVDMHPKEKIPTVEVVLTILHAGGKFGGEGYKVSGGLHGVGVSVVNALSTQVIVQVRRDGKEYEISFDHGKTKEKLHEIGMAEETGTTVTFWPDPEIFKETTEYDYLTLAARFREMAFLNKGLKITLTDERSVNDEGNPTREVFQALGGLQDFVRFLNKDKEILNSPIYFEAENDDGIVEVAMQWSTSYSSNSVLSFANNIHTIDGGTHLDGFKQGVTRTINDYARSKGILKEKDSKGQGTEQNLAWESVLLARNVHRPTAQYYINSMVDGFLELHGDRAFADDGAILAGIGWIAGQPVTVLAEEKGADLQQRIKRNFGCPQPEGYRKTMRLMKQAEKFGRPIVCLVDTQGAFCGMEAEERGQGNAIAENLAAMSALKVPVVCIVLGEGGSGGALALAVGIRVAMQEHAVYSVLSPEGFASILWKDRSRAAEAAAVMKMSAAEACELGLIEEVLPEGDAGEAAHETPEIAARNVQEFVVRSLRELAPMSEQELKDDRYRRFRAF